MTRNSQSGFTLIEVLVAFSILSLTIIVGFQIFSSGLHRIRSAGEVSARLEAAKTVLAQETLGVRPQQDSGANGDLEIIKTTATNETPQWTKVIPVRVQVRDGNSLLLETIVLTHEVSP
jgi:prepilin-type N-terminal cleavage/methylation domain-containing protein